MAHGCPAGAQAFVGYWGFGHAPALHSLLASLLLSGGAWAKRAGGCFPDQASDEAWVWQVASTAPSSPVSGRDQTAGDQQRIASTAAGGLPTDHRFEGGAMVEAWVITGREESTGQWWVRLGREPFGRAPLYWLQRDRVLWFASQLHLLLPLIEKPAVSVAGLYGYSCCSYVPTPHTPIQGLAAVPAGTELRWQAGSEPPLLRGPRSCPLVAWREAPDPLREEPVAIARLQAALRAATLRQISDLRADQPVGVALSGGLDSSITAALLVQAGLRVRAYTLDLNPPGVSEAPYAQRVAEALGIPLVRVKVTPQRVRRALRATVRALDVPFGDGVTVPLFLLAERAAQDTAVLFNGEGGDQLFAGWTNKPLIAAGVYHRQQGGGDAFAEHYLRTFHRLWGLEERVFQPATLARVAQLNAGDFLRDALDPAPAPSFLHRMRRASLLLKGAQNIQPRVSNLGLFHGLAVRSPFCDLELAQLCFAIAAPLHLQGACEKTILKRAAAPWLPAEVVWREKRGMGIPLTHWCLHALWHDLGDWLNPAVLAKEGHWQADLASRLVNGRVSASLEGRRIGECLWLLLMWQLWWQVFLPTAEPAHSWQHPFWQPPWLWRLRRRWRETP